MNSPHADLVRRFRDGAGCRARPRTPTWPLGVAIAAVVGCTPVPAPAPSAPAPVEASPRVAQEDEDLVPAGFGSLRQDDFSMEITDAALHVKITPLAEEIIRLAAPDTYERLHALARSRSAEAWSMTERGTAADLFLVSFFSRHTNVEYDPDELQLMHRGRTVRPVGVVPLTTGWGRHLLQPQQTQSAIYVFEPEFDYALPIMARYSLKQNDDWHRAVIPRLDDERTRVLSRAQAQNRGT